MGGSKRTDPDGRGAAKRASGASLRRIGFLGFRDALALDIVGPMEVFSLASAIEPGRTPRYRCVLTGLNRRPFVTESGLVIRPAFALADSPALDTLVVPGGAGLRDRATSARIVDWLRASAPRARRVASVCTGIYALAPTGLLDGRRVTTHWRFAEDLARRFPKLAVDANAIFIRDGPYYTSAGVTAGLDLALALVEEDHGAQLAIRVAREIVVHHKRAGGQEQYSEPLRFQVQHQDRLGAVASWLSAHRSPHFSARPPAHPPCPSPPPLSPRPHRTSLT